MNKFILLVSFLLLINTIQLKAQNGKIYFSNGKTLNFSQLKYIKGSIQEKNATCDDGKMRIFYNNTIREVALDKIKSIEVSSWKPNCSDCDQIVYAKLNIKTTTGAVVNNTNQRYLEYVGVYIYDELTGEQVYQKIYFGINGRLNIKKIVIY